MSADLVKYFNLLAQHLKIDLQAARLFASSTDKGNVNENAFKQFLRPLLPSRYAIGVGEVIASDVNDRTRLTQSEQMDVVVYDPFASSIFGWGESGLNLFPIESVYAVVEIKTCFHKTDDVKQAAKQVYEVKQIHKKYLPGNLAPFTAVFAFASSVSNKVILHTLGNMLLEERPDIVLFLGSDGPGEQPKSSYIAHWYYVTGGHGPIGFVTANEAVAQRGAENPKVVCLTLGETENTLLWFYLFLLARLQMVDTQIDKARCPNLWRYVFSEQVDLGYVTNLPPLS